MSDPKTDPPAEVEEADAPLRTPGGPTVTQVIRERGGCWKGLLVIAVTFLVVAWLGYRCAKDVVETSIGAMGEMTTSLETTEEIVDVSAVVTQIRGLARLETASMDVMQIITARQSHGVIPDAIAGDELTLAAVGEVIAGIDLSKFSEEDARIEPDGTLVLRLPRAEILVTRLDNSESRVVHRDTGLLRKADKGLEGRTREQAEIAIRNKALRNGIRDLARDNAERQLSEFLNKLGAERIRFESVDEIGVTEMEH